MEAVIRSWDGGLLRQATWSVTGLLAAAGVLAAPRTAPIIVEKRARGFTATGEVEPGELGIGHTKYDLGSPGD
ncbi:hypothetical protein [Kyrpidia sp.]|uniref:hypothetical protein n=1 Tax=Kyrpidia sp. TaxID=2073077 RepID=UPI00258E7672|nr:hypothetical protein [Kyrpidia sp.]